MQQNGATHQQIGADNATPLLIFFAYRLKAKLEHQMSNNDLYQMLKQVICQKIQPISDLIYSILVLTTKFYIFDPILSSQLSQGLTLLLLTTGLGLNHKVKRNFLATVFEIIASTDQHNDES